MITLAKAKNMVIAGDYINNPVIITTGIPQIIINFKGKCVKLDYHNVSAYELITDEHRKSAASGVARGIVGGTLLGPVGMLAGGLSAKSKGIYQVAIEFKNGKKSLLEINDDIYKALVKSCFAPAHANHSHSKKPSKKSSKLRKIFLFFSWTLVALLLLLLFFAFSSSPSEKDSVSDEYIAEIDSYNAAVIDTWDNVVNTYKSYDSGEITLDDLMSSMGHSNQTFIMTASEIDKAEETTYSRMVGEITDLYYDTTINIMNFLHEGDTSSLEDLEHVPGQIIEKKSDIDQARDKLIK